MLIKITQVQNHLDFSFCLVNGLFHISGLAIVSCMKLFLFNLQSWIFQIISYCLFLSILFKFNDDFSPWRWFICACKFFYIRCWQLDMLQLPLLRLQQNCELPPKCEMQSELWNLANNKFFWRFGALSNPRFPPCPHSVFATRLRSWNTTFPTLSFKHNRWDSIFKISKSKERVVGIIY